MSECYNKYLDYMPYSSYVRPSIAAQLIEAGITDDSLFWWSITDKYFELVTGMFDHDDYYAAARKVLLNGSKATIIATFSTQQLEYVLPPNWLLTRNSNYEFELCMEDIWKLDPVTNERMVDAFAMMLLQGIEKRVFDIKIINEQLRRTVPQSSVPKS